MKEKWTVFFPKKRGVPRILQVSWWNVARGRAGELQTSQLDFDILKNTGANY